MLSPKMILCALRRWNGQLKVARGWRAWDLKTREPWPCLTFPLPGNSQLLTSYMHQSTTLKSTELRETGVCTFKLQMISQSQAMGWKVVSGLCASSVLISAVECRFCTYADFRVMWRNGESQSVATFPHGKLLSCSSVGNACCTEFWHISSLWRYGDPLFHNKISFIWYTSLFKNQRVLTRVFTTTTPFTQSGCLQFLRSRFICIRCCWEHLANSHGRPLF